MADSDNFTVKDIIEKDIFTLLGAESLTAEEKNELMAKMLDTIRFRVIDRVSEMISKDEMNMWMDLMEPDKNEELNKFLADRKINLSQMMMEEAVNYKIQLKTYANYTKSNRDIISATQKEDQNKTVTNDASRTITTGSNG